LLEQSLVSTEYNDLNDVLLLDALLPLTSVTRVLDFWFAIGARLVVACWL